MKSWFAQDGWPVKWTKQDSAHSYQTPTATLFLLSGRCLHQLHSFSFASMSRSHNHKSLSSGFLGAAEGWQGGTFHLHLQWPLVPWKLSQWRQDWTIQLRDDQMLREDEALCAKGCDFYFLLELIIGTEFQSCLNKHRAKETLSTLAWHRFFFCQHFIPFA